MRLPWEPPHSQPRIPLGTEPFGITACGWISEGAGIIRLSEIPEKSLLEKCAGFDPSWRLILMRLP